MPDSMLCQEPKQPKLLDQVRQYLRLHHYSIHTERSYVDWIVRFIRLHRMGPRNDLFPAEPKIEVFLTHLGVEAKAGVLTGSSVKYFFIANAGVSETRLAGIRCMP